ncbi:MAG: hypothetical protein ABEJ28_02300 [Salinigranum sp.]
MNVERDEAIHGGIVVVAVAALAVVVAVAATFAGNELQMVLYSSVYVAGICAFWLGYWVLKGRVSGGRGRLDDSNR